MGHHDCEAQDENSQQMTRVDSDYVQVRKRRKMKFVVVESIAIEIACFHYYDLIRKLKQTKKMYVKPKLHTHINIYIIVYKYAHKR